MDSKKWWEDLIRRIARQNLTTKVDKIERV